MIVLFLASIFKKLRFHQDFPVFGQLHTLLGFLNGYEQLFQDNQKQMMDSKEIKQKCATKKIVLTLIKIISASRR